MRSGKRPGPSGSAAEASAQRAERHTLAGDAAALTRICRCGTAIGAPP
jgi:hypothetical protein